MSTPVVSTSVDLSKLERASRDEQSANSFYEEIYQKAREAAHRDLERQERQERARPR